jgi:hypothetical protein
MSGSFPKAGALYPLPKGELPKRGKGKIFPVPLLFILLFIILCYMSDYHISALKSIILCIFLAKIAIYLPFLLLCIVSVHHFIKKGFFIKNTALIVYFA